MITALLVLGGALVFHELGHIFTLRYYNGQYPNIYFREFSCVIGEPKDYRYLGPLEKLSVYLAGVFMGYAFIGSLVLSYPQLPFVFITTSMYTILCVHDCDNILRLFFAKRD